MFLLIFKSIVSEPPPLVFLPFVHPACHWFCLSECAHSVLGLALVAIASRRKARKPAPSAEGLPSTCAEIFSALTQVGHSSKMSAPVAWASHRQCWSGTCFSRWRAERESLFSLMPSSVQLRPGLLGPQHLLSPDIRACRAAVPGRERCSQPYAVP